MTVWRSLLRIASRRGRPGTLLQVGDSGGACLYLEVSMSPVSIVTALDVEDVRELRATLTTWLEERDAGGRRRELAEPVPLVAGRIARGQLDAGTVQLRTV